jgi:hypothetical protein
VGRQLSYIAAIGEAIAQEMARDETVLYFQVTEGAVRFLDEAEISDEDKRKIYHRNAERIFGIAPGEPA